MFINLVPSTPYQKMIEKEIDIYRKIGSKPGIYYFKDGYNNLYRKWFYNFIIKKYLKDCESVLDVACGNGLFVKCARELGKKVIGIDLDEPNAKKDVIIGDFFKYEFKEKFDAVFSSFFVEHVDPFEFMEIVNKICKKKVIIITERPSRFFWDDPSHKRPYTKKSLLYLIGSYRFVGEKALNLYPTRNVMIIGRKNGQ